ncbi:hypothetical protein CDD81_1653 [Ophiocordyceps australis]|uniref:PH-response regulator protein palH/RIM21 n=1 Tax=Ophiocordyceps australis TaxID=1399860 RepID=A0A2C5Y0N7_9HYPO|nr:hypothetical protein CDD81_1653 [Ophiocordyceps australis]
MESLAFASTTLTAAPTLCTTTVMPAKGFLTMADSPPHVTLARAVVYEVPCPTKPLNSFALVSPESAEDSSLNPHDDSSDTRFSDFRDPFYASTFPICYALAATTVTAYMLLIMLFITPRSFLDGGVVYLGRRRGFTHSHSGGETIGGRPWLQKVAALTVAVSLTIATHDTFKVAQRQYQWGAQNATVLQSAVLGSVELRVIRLISNTFLWLAQAQTLIRLFPRHREKVIIKWAAFALITLDLIFSAINSFREHDRGSLANPMAGSFEHPIPALSYLFQLLLGVLYAAWVIYYSLMKKRYAFYHPLMKNMPLLAIVSLTAILVPVVFFIMDICKPEFTGWGDYVRWVGAAAASVIVWEWVERIEALEREEKKDCILGREVFDGDETLEVNASEFPWLRNRKGAKAGGGGGGGARRYEKSDDNAAGHAQRDQGILRGGGWPGVSVITGRQRTHGRDAHEHHSQRTVGDILRPPIWPARPATAVTPISRTDTPSAASTVYAVRYQGTPDATGRTPEPLARSPDSFPPQQSTLELSRQDSLTTGRRLSEEVHAGQGAATHRSNGHVAYSLPPIATDVEANNATMRSNQWRTMTLGSSPQLDVESDEPTWAGARRQADQGKFERQRSRYEAGKWDIRSRLEFFAANQAERFREKLRPTTDTAAMPVTVLPAPPRRGAALQKVLEEEEVEGPGGSAQERRSGDFKGGQEWQQVDERASASLVNPPLWPGVRRRVQAFEEADDETTDGGSVAETASMESERRELDDEGGGPSRTC